MLGTPYRTRSAMPKTVVMHSPAPAAILGTRYATSVPFLVYGFFAGGFLGAMGLTIGLPAGGLAGGLAAGFLFLSPMVAQSAFFLFSPCGMTEPSALVVVAVDLDQTALTTVVGRMETAADKKSADIVMLGGACAEWFARWNSKARDGLVHDIHSPPRQRHQHHPLPPFAASLIKRKKS